MLAQATPSPSSRSVTWLHANYTVLVTPQESDGRAGMFEAVHAPNAGPPRHVHHKEDEIIYLAEGCARFWLEGRTFMRYAGEAVFIPRGKEHTFRVMGDRPARFVTLITPGGFESFFHAAAERGLTVPGDMAELQEVAKLYNAEFTGPPLDA